MHYSCDHGNLWIVQLLLQAHPNLDLPNNVSLEMYIANNIIHSLFIPQNGWTPLMKASFENRDKVVQLLVNAGATLDLLHRVCM